MQGGFPKPEGRRKGLFVVADLYDLFGGTRWSCLRFSLPFAACWNENGLLLNSTWEDSEDSTSRLEKHYTHRWTDVSSSVPPSACPTPWRLH
jgi:hypothetical protein